MRGCDLKSLARHSVSGYEGTQRGEGGGLREEEEKGPNKASKDLTCSRFVDQGAAGRVPYQGVVDEDEGGLDRSSRGG